MARPGRLPTYGVVPLAPGLDALGLLARTAGGPRARLDGAHRRGRRAARGSAAAIAPATVRGRDAALAPPAPLTVAVAAARGARRRRRRRARRRRARRRAARGERRTRGARVRRAGVRRLEPPARDADRRARAATSTAPAAGGRTARTRYGEVVAGPGARPGGRSTAAGRRRPRASRRPDGRRLRDGLVDADVLVLPTTPTVAPPRATTDESRVRRSERRHAAELTRLCGPVNAPGWPP